MRNMERRRAAFAGSFDPWTDAHSRVVARGLEAFDEVIVMVADNPMKRHMFTADERKAIAEASLRQRLTISFENVRVIRMAEGYTADHAKALGCCALLRGIRVTDLNATAIEVQNEESIANFNLERAGLHTMFVFTGLSVSSTRVRSKAAPEFDGITIDQGIAEAAVPLINEGLRRARAQQLPPLPARVLDDVSNPQDWPPITGSENF